MKILVIQQKMIGDVLTSSILFEALRENYPDAELHYLINSHTLPVIEQHPYIDKYIFYTPEIEQSKSKLWSLVKEVRAQRYHIVIDVYSKLSSNLISLCSGAKYRISYHKWYTWFLYSHTVKRRKKAITAGKLAIENRVQLLEPLALTVKPNLKPKINLTSLEKNKAKQFLQDNGLDLSKPIIMISALGSGPIKTYPFSYLAEVIDTICDTNKNLQLLFNYIPKQVEQARAIFNLCSSQSQSQIFFDVFGNSLRDFLGLVSYCSAVIGNEGGAINMAKALNVPTFCIFSPWNAKFEWSVYDNGTTNVSVHLEDFNPEPFKGITKYKTLKPKTEELYQQFKPLLFKDQLKTYVQTVLTHSENKTTSKVITKTADKNTVKISAVIITFNEEQHIEKCIISLLDVADEIIVVDSYSTDKTVEICKQYGVTVVMQAFLGYQEQKNFAIEQASYEHILSLDGDEALSENLKTRIIEVKSNWKFDGYYFNRRNRYCGQWIKHSDWYPDKKLRLFKKGSGSWKGINPHDTYFLKSGYRHATLKGDLLHFIFSTYSEHNQKIEKFTSIAAQEYYKLGIKSNLWKIIMRPTWAFIKAYILRLGFLDGLNGFVISVQTANYTFIKYIKLKALYKSEESN